jgi:hypothetical protein
MSSKYYISKIVVELNDEGKLTSREYIITRADSRTDANATALVNVARFKKKLEALGIDCLHINKYDKKRYNKLVRDQNKYRKNVKLTVADLAKMTEESNEAFGDKNV